MRSTSSANACAEIPSSKARSGKKCILRIGKPAACLLECLTRGRAPDLRCQAASPMPSRPIADHRKKPSHLRHHLGSILLLRPRPLLAACDGGELHGLRDVIYMTTPRFINLYRNPRNIHRRVKSSPPVPVSTESESASAAPATGAFFPAWISQMGTKSAREIPRIRSRRGAFRARRSPRPSGRGRAGTSRGGSWRRRRRRAG